jgi:peptide/nickel transport system permease protein
VILYLLRRMLVAALLVFAVASAALVMSRLAPGDYASQALGVGARPETLAAARARYGLDRPVSTQYVDWIGRVVRLDFGRSLAYDRPVRDLISERALNTAVLALAALVLATAVGLPLGVVSGARPGGWMAAAVRGASMLLLSMPPLLTSLLLVFIAARTGWLPVGGMRSADAGGGLADLVRHMIVPVLALALPVGALLERLQSQAIADVVYQPFVLATFARGVPLRRVLWRDAFKASLKPVAAIYGVIVGTLLSGSFAVEIVTAWPGLGRLTLDALRARDVYLVAGCAAAGALFLAVGTFLSDAALAVVDPRATE